MKATLGLLTLFTLVLGGGYLWSTRGTVVITNPPPQVAITATSTPSSVASAPSVNSQTVVSTDTGIEAPNTYTLAQVSSHATSDNCWVTINGNIYDLTKWISQHPGGETAILSLCGKDGTSAFNDQHGNSGNANSALAEFKIGILIS